MALWPIDLKDLKLKENQRPYIVKTKNPNYVYGRLIFNQKLC